MEEEDAFLDSAERSNGQINLSELNALGPIIPAPDKATHQDPWEWARELFQSDEIIELRVHGYNKGGLLVMLGKIQGFVPASQITDFPQLQLERERLQALSSWVGRVLRLKVTEIGPGSSRLIFSERATLVRAVDRQTLLHAIKPGDRVTGTVNNLTEFGAFIDLGNLEGLLHISEISWRRLSRPGDVLHPGQQLELVVIEKDVEEGKVRLSSKRLRPDPWVDADLRYRPNQLVRGIVHKIVHYGVFVTLEDELDGLVHITEMAEGNFLHPQDVVRKGEIITVRVISVDPQGMRIALTLRGVNDPVDPVA